MRSSVVTDPSNKGYAMLVDGIKKLAPQFEGPMTPEESVRLQMDVINRWPVERSGEFVSHHGDKEWL